MDPVQLILRVLHIGAAVVWIGGGTLWGLILMPALAQMGPTLPRGVMPTLSQRMMKVIPHAGVLTLVTGVLVMWQLGGFAGARPYQDPWAHMLLGALALTALMLVLMFAVMIPTFRRMGQLGASAPPGPPGPEALAAMARLKRVSMANLAMGWLVVLLMVVATSWRTA